MIVYFLPFSVSPLYPTPQTGNAAAAPPRTTSVTLELEHAAERAAWNSTASCVVIGDVSGRIHFVTGEGTLLFSQPLAKPVEHHRYGSWVE